MKKDIQKEKGLSFRCGLKRKIAQRRLTFFGTGFVQKTNNEETSEEVEAEDKMCLDAHLIR